MPTEIVGSLQTIREQLQRIAFLENENRELKAAIHAKSIDAAYWEREHRINVAHVSQSAKERLHRAFEGHTNNAGLKEAINVEKRGA
jgi:hypothetical protein